LSGKLAVLVVVLAMATPGEACHGALCINSQACADVVRALLLKASSHELREGREWYEWIGLGRELHPCMFLKSKLTLEIFLEVLSLTRLMQKFTLTFEDS